MAFIAFIRLSHHTKGIQIYLLFIFACYVQMGYSFFYNISPSVYNGWLEVAHHFGLAVSST